MGKAGHLFPLSSPRRLLYSLLSASAVLTLSDYAYAQIVSTSIPVPPLQWINLTGYLTGPAPPPLKDASVGYDEGSRLLVVFGGESQQGLPQSQTYLLDLKSLTWKTPSPPADLTRQPPARSAALSASDTAASYRAGHIVFGGRGSGGQPLSDIWEFSFNAEFWTEVTVSGGGPSPRWAAAGGNDNRASPIQDPHRTTPNNTFYVAGGFDEKGGISLSDLWLFNITGTLSPNLPNDVEGSWEKLTLQDSSLPALGGSATSAVFADPNQFIAAIGGCNTAEGAEATCALNTSFVLNVGAARDPFIPSCPAPRFSATVSPNYCGASSSFTSQVFHMLGTFDSSQWQDDGGLNRGEVDILDLQTGAWARILPAGDPVNGQPAFPGPRQGAAAVSFPQTLVGADSARNSASDTIVFGGRDASGTYLNEVWLLRAYNDVITHSNQHWSGYGSGNLQSGVNANGQGVTISYMSNCASFIGGPSPTPSTSSMQPSSPTGGPSAPPVPGSNESQSSNPYDTSATHKILAPVSVAVALPAILFSRFSLASSTTPSNAAGKPGLLYLAGFLASSAFAIGIAGLTTAFTSITYTPSLVKRSSVPTLPTSHSRAGIALFVAFYVLGAVTLCIAIWQRWRSRDHSSSGIKRTRTLSNDLAEKAGLYQNRAASPGPPEQTRPRSGDHLNPWPFFGLGNAGRRSTESGTTREDRTPSPSAHSFEVVNRPARARHASAHSLAAFSDPRSTSTSPHNLADMSWSFPPRSASRLDGLDERRNIDPSTPGTAVMEVTSTRGLMEGGAHHSHPEMPTIIEATIHLLLQVALLALCIFCLIALWKRAPVATFAVFLAWTVGYYALICTLAWFGIPRVSILAVLVSRLRSNPATHPPKNATSPEGVPFTSGHGPYQNQPPYRTAHDSDYPTSISHAGHTIDYEYDDDEDEDSRQRRMEDEMSRRNVNIITTMRHKLVVKNMDPEPS